MKIQRYKRVQKVLKFYKNFGFHPPFRILLDGTICRAALEAKINVQEQLTNYIGGDAVHIVTTQCVVQEVESLSKIVKDLYGAWLVVKQFPTHKCGHKKERKPAIECIKSLIEKDNPNRYILATMDDELRDYMDNNVIGIPIIYLHDKSPTIQKPSKLSEEFLHNKEQAASSHEMETLKSLKRKIIGEEAEPIQRKKKKGVNPLSCLKSKKKPHIRPTSDKPKRNRNKRKEQDIQSCIKKVFDIS